VVSKLRAVVHSVPASDFDVNWSVCSS